MSGRVRRAAVAELTPPPVAGRAGHHYRAGMTEPPRAPRLLILAVVGALAVIGVLLWLWVVSTEAPAVPGEPVDTSGNGILAVWIIGGTVVVGFLLVVAGAAVAARIVAARRARR